MRNRVISSLVVLALAACAGAEWEVGPGEGIYGGVRPKQFRDR